MLTPSRGMAGHHVYIDLRLLPQLYSSQYTCKLSFGTLAVETWFCRVPNRLPNGTVEECDVCAAIVPPFQETNWFDGHVPVQALLLSGPDIIVSMLHVGMFEYLPVDKVGVAIAPTVASADINIHQQQQVPQAHNRRPSKKSLSNSSTATVGGNVALSYPAQQQSQPAFDPETGEALNVFAIPCKSNVNITNIVWHRDEFDQVLIIPWSEMEISRGRRIVELTISATEDGKYMCGCRPVIEVESEKVSRDAGNILVSCIYWAAENQFIVTGVDVIYAVESILGVPYNTDQKNRIRRNLEKFNPRTVAKTSGEHYDFFWKIMAYEDPKPRNIEANVKVYPWNLMVDAMERVIEKFGPHGSFKGRNSDVFREAAQHINYGPPHPSFVAQIAATPVQEQPAAAAHSAQVTSDQLN